MKPLFNIIALIVIALFLTTGCVSENSSSASDQWSKIRDALATEKFDKAAKLTMKEISSARYYDKSFAVWRWFESNFQMAPQYNARQRAFGEAIVARFKKGDADEKRLIAVIFRHPGAENLPYEEFKELVLQ